MLSTIVANLPYNYQTVTLDSEKQKVFSNSTVILSRKILVISLNTLNVYSSTLCEP